MDKYDKFDKLLAFMGAEELLDAIAQAMSTDQLNGCCDYIANCHDINLQVEDE